MAASMKQRWKRAAESLVEAAKEPWGETANQDPRRLTEQDVFDFEHAAMDRPPETSTGRPRGDFDTRSVQRGDPTPRDGATGSLAAILASRDRVRLAVLRQHLRWARKQAAKRGIDPRKVRWWEL
jgi:hypothetical protein